MPQAVAALPDKSSLPSSRASSVPSSTAARPFSPAARTQAPVAKADAPSERRRGFQPFTRSSQVEAANRASTVTSNNNDSDNDYKIKVL